MRAMLCLILLAGCDLVVDDVNVGDINVDVDEGTGTTTTSTTPTGTTPTTPTTPTTSTTPCVPVPIVFYDGVDDDCDGLIECDQDADGVDGDSVAGDGPCDLGTDCNDTDASVSAFTDWYVDIDGDLFTDANSLVNSCGSGGIVSLVAVPSVEPDCNDADAAVNPDALEVCDGVDNDCDGSLDDLTDWYPDVDSDGFGDEFASATAACAAPLDSVADNTDCNDGDWEISPAVPENSSNGIDDNCDGIVDECAAGESRSTFVFDTESVACTDLVVSLQSFDPLDNQTFGEPLNATSTDIVDGLDNDGDGISDFNVMVLDAVLTVESLNCLPDEDTWYISGRYTMDGATHYSCEGDNIPVGEYIVNGTMTLWQDGVEVPLEIVNNYDTPLTLGTGPGCEYGGAD